MSVWGDVMTETVPLGFDMGARIWSGVSGRRGTIVPGDDTLSRVDGRVWVRFDGDAADTAVKTAVLHPMNPKPAEPYHQPYCPTWEHEHPETEEVIGYAVKRWVQRHLAETERRFKGRRPTADMCVAYFLEAQLSLDSDAVARDVLAALRNEES